MPHTTVTHTAEASPEEEAAPDEASSQREGPAISAAAARIYMLGEERYAEGRFDEAVALWGHAMLQLPADSSADTVRHKLIERMGYGLLQAHHATGDLSYLVDGQAMCELYIAKHEALFGETEQARAQRGSIYELLYEFDSRLDGQTIAAQDEDPPLAAAGATEPDTRVADAASPEPPPARREVEEGEDYRIIDVRRIAWAEPDDPRVRDFHRDARFTGPSTLDHGRDRVHGPRVLVRVGAVPRPKAAADAKTRAAARRAGMAVVEAARPALERCYEVAMSRDPVIAARVEVSLTVQTDGTVRRPMLVDGVVVDAQGDVCTIAALKEARVESAPLDEAIEVAMPIHFFYQDATRTAELFRRERPVTGRAYELTSRTSGLPPIDEFMSQEPSARLRMIRKRGYAANDPRNIRGEPMTDPGDIRD